jgi:hypothetical protein
MKLRFCRVSAIAAGILALGTLAGVTGAAPASAASATHLCIDDYIPGLGGGTHCAVPDGLENPIVLSNAGASDWSYSTTDGVKGDIKQANVNLCMQLNAADYTVRAATCVNDDAEEWIPEYDSTAKRTEFVSSWGLDNGQNDWCLSGAEDGTEDLDVNYCEGYAEELWGTS